MPLLHVVVPFVENIEVAAMQSMSAFDAVAYSSAGP